MTSPRTFCLKEGSLRIDFIMKSLASSQCRYSVKEAETTFTFVPVTVVTLCLALFTQFRYPLSDKRTLQRYIRRMATYVGRRPRSR
jgi:hypothetical protein